MITNPHGSIFNSLDNERELESSMFDVDQRHVMAMSMTIQDQTHRGTFSLDKRHGMAMIREFLNAINYTIDALAEHYQPGSNPMWYGMAMSTTVQDQTQCGTSGTDQRHGMAMRNTAITPGGRQAAQIRTLLRRKSASPPVMTSCKSTPEPDIGNDMTANFQISESANGNAEAHQLAKRVKVAHKKSGCMLSADGQHVVSMAYSLFKCKLTANNPFPNITRQVKEFMVEALTMAQQKKGMSVPMGAYEINLDREYLRLAYGFVLPTDCEDNTSGQMNMICQNNHDLIVLLKAKSSFAYMNPNDRMVMNSMYQNPLISKLINIVWFTNAKEDGILFPEHFNSFCIMTITLVLTVI
ncbi:hypothetical protein HD554DRAFT_2042827 [Boletus coccyginus]|nr:hypothetical protein HD554DRAFT_2042827 [Boletus coccyginus]